MSTFSYSTALPCGWRSTRQLYSNFDNIYYNVKSKKQYFDNNKICTRRNLLDFAVCATAVLNSFTTAWSSQISENSVALTPLLEAKLRTASSFGMTKASAYACVLRKKEQVTKESWQCRRLIEQQFTEALSTAWELSL